jgi:dolichol-phosphate mannosyltransferase
MKVSIIIPVFNEVETFEELIKKVKNNTIEGIEKEIIIVDDFSTDGTKELIRKAKGVKKIYNGKNRGKGFCLKKGFNIAKGDIFIIQDADLEYCPKEYINLIKPIIEKKTKVVYGSRLLDKKNKRGGLFFYIGGRTVTFFTNLLYGSSLTDEPTCYKIFYKSLKSLLISAKGNRFEWEPEITAKILRKGYRIQEVPIKYAPRRKNKGKKIKFKDGFIAIWTLFKWRVKRIS